MPELLHLLTERADTLARAIFCCTSFALALVLYVVLKADGVLGVQAWLAGRDAKDRQRAKRFLRRSQDTNNEAAQREDLLTAWLDLSTELNAVTRERVVALNFGKWASLALIAGGGLLGFVRPFDSLLGAGFTAVFFLLFGLFLVKILPILWLALHHGRPKASPESTTGSGKGVLEEQDAAASRTRVAEPAQSSPNDLDDEAESDEEHDEERGGGG